MSGTVATVTDLRPLEPADRDVLERLWQLYRHDLSEFRGTHGPGGFVGSLPEADGRFHTRGLEPYLSPDPDRAPYLAWRDASPVGFVLVSRLTTPRFLMSEFFVVHGLRGRGVAGEMVEQIFARHPGVWEIPFQENNVAAARFWRRIGGQSAVEERRPVPGKPEIPPDVWLTVRVG